MFFELQQQMAQLLDTDISSVGLYLNDWRIGSCTLRSTYIIYSTFLLQTDMFFELQQQMAQLLDTDAP